MKKERGADGQQEIEELILGINDLKKEVLKNYLYTNRQAIGKAIQGFALEIENLVLLKSDFYEPGNFDQLSITPYGEWGDESSDFGEEISDRVLMQFALVSRPDFQKIESEYLERCKDCDGAITTTESHKCFNEIREEYEPIKREFIEEHKLELLTGLTGVLTETLRTFTSNQ